VLLRLTDSEYQKEYPLLVWKNVPTAAETFTYRFFRAPRVMTRDYDKPDLPFPHSNVLVYDALLDLATYNELDSESVNIWRDKQQHHVQSLYLTKLDGDSTGAMGNSIVGVEFDRP
jgi:hypothetical protein